MMEIEVKEKIKFVKKNNKFEIIISDYDLVEYLLNNVDDYEIEFDTNVPDRPILVIKFYLKG